MRRGDSDISIQDVFQPRVRLHCKKRDFCNAVFIVALRKINPNRAALVVEQLALIRKHLALVEREMQKAAAQKDMLAA